MMTNKTRILSAIATIAIISSALLAGMQGYDKAYAQQVPYLQSQPNTISVTGQASESVNPDLVSIQLGVDTQAKNAQNATSQNAQEMNATVAAIENLGITTSEINTSSFTISPIYNNTGQYAGYDGSNQLLGYKVSNTILIQTTKLELAGSILDTAVDAGANRVDDVSFTLSPQKAQEVKDSLLENAILDAQSRAQKALSPLGQKIIGVQTVTLSEFNVPPPGPLYQGRFMSAMAAPATPIFTSSQEITTTVNVTFLIGPQ